MKNCKWLFIVLSILLYAFKTQAQDNTKITIENSEENMEAEKFKGLKSTYNYIVRAQVEELSLLKFDLISPSLYAMNNSEVDTVMPRALALSFERKIKPEWSWIIISRIKANRKELKEFIGGAGVRYYYNMKKRIAKGKSANNFSANYLSARFDMKQRTDIRDDAYSLNILYGIQRRIGKWGYLDFEIGYDIVLDAYKGSSTGIDLISAIEVGIAF